MEYRLRTTNTKTSICLGTDIYYLIYYIIYLFHNLFILGRETNTCAYIKRRLAMCARKLGRIKEAVKLMKEVTMNYSSRKVIG